MSYYIIFAVLVAALLLAFGVPAITRMVKVPRPLRIRTLPPDELSEEASVFFGLMDQKAEELRFHPVFDFTLPGFGVDNENRQYYRPDLATAFTASIHRSGGRTIRALEFTTPFLDGVEVSTTNAPVSMVFDVPPWHVVKRLPGLSDPASLLAAHERQLEERRRQGVQVREYDESALGSEIEKSLARQMSHQVERGLFREDEESDLYVATPWVALRGIANFVNPFADEFTLFRFATGFGLGLILFLGATLLVEPLGLEPIVRDLLGDRPLRQSQIDFILYCPAFILGGLAIGFAFKDKGFLWGFLLSLPAILLLPARVASPIFYSLIAAQSGKVANAIRQSGESGPGRGALSTSLLILVVLIVLGYMYIK